jgi:hypothetical protein
MANLPDTLKLLDPGLHKRYSANLEMITQGLEELKDRHLAETLIESKEAMLQKVKALSETNPMLGHRGVRLGITYPEIYAMQIRAILERDGVIGASCDVWMLAPGWKRGDSNEGVTLNTLADHIDHVCQLAGNSRHAGIGSDLDGGFGRDQSPQDLETIADLQRLSEILAGRGYQTEDIRNIMHGNWLRLLRRCWAC